MSKIDPAILKLANDKFADSPISRGLTIGAFNRERDDLAAGIQDFISEWLGEQRRAADMNVAAE